MQPVADFMGAQIYLIFKKLLTDFSEIRSAIPCLMISLTRRDRLHWLTSYPKSRRFLQARLIIIRICAGVNLLEEPERFSSDKILIISACRFLVQKIQSP
ncbi:MAG: hypothetical protein WCD89_07590 [Anaerocolumna sp.]